MSRQHSWRPGAGRVPVGAACPVALAGTAQDVERTRFEYHPQHASRCDVLLGHCGRRILAEC